MSRPPNPENYARDAVGNESWRKLIAWRGGTEYDVPTSLECARGTELMGRVGRDAATRLIAFAGGTRVYLAAGHGEILLARYHEIVERQRAGQTPAQIAIEMTFEGRYTERTVRMVLAGKYEDFAQKFGLQSDLFNNTS